jgi:hypothetical protein
MTAIAGLDLGYGSQIKIVKTNYLIQGAHTQGTAQALANLLDIYNHKVRTDARGKSGLECDYIVSADSTAAGALVAEAPINSTVDPRVIDSTTLTNWPVQGPSATSLAKASSLAAHQNTAADQGTAANGNIICVLSVGMVTFSSVLMEAPVVLDVLGGTGGMEQDFNSRLMVSIAGSTAEAGAMNGRTPHLDFTEAFATFIAGATGTGNTLDLTAAALNADYVAHGNAAGTTPTELSDLAAITADTGGIIQVVSLVDCS